MKEIDLFFSAGSFTFTILLFVHVPSKYLACMKGVFLTTCMHMYECECTSFLFE